MSVEDKKLIAELKKMAKLNGIKPFGHIEIASIKNDMPLQTLKNKLSAPKSFIDFNCLMTIYNAIDDNPEQDLCIYKKLLPILGKLIVQNTNIDIEISKREAEINLIKTIRDACQFICTSDFVFSSITSLEVLHEIIGILFNPQSSIKVINISLNQELLLDAITIIESYAYSDGGNFSDVLTVKLFVPTYTIFANIIAGMSDGELVGFIKNNDNVLVEISDIGKSLVGCEIEAQLHQKAVWDELPKSPELRVLTKLQRDGVDVSDRVIEIVTVRYENTVPYIKGNVFSRLSEIDADLPTDFVKFANDNGLESQL